MSGAARMRREDAVAWLADLASTPGATVHHEGRFAGASRMFRTLTGLDTEQTQRLISAELQRRKDAADDFGRCVAARDLGFGELGNS